MSDDAFPGRCNSAMANASSASAAGRARSLRRGDKGGEVGPPRARRPSPSERRLRRAWPNHFAFAASAGTWRTSCAGSTSLAAPVLLGPAALAFAKGGYFDVPRLVAGVVACALVVVVAARDRRPVPRSALARRGRAGGADGVDRPVDRCGRRSPAPPSDDFQRALLYLFAFVAAVAVLRPPGVRRLVEPVLLASIVAAALYGLSERLLPGIFSLQDLPSADDRLAWPLTYWNAMGALTGMGLVLAALACRRAWRSATAPLLGLACYLTFSRGALGATAAGLAVLVALAPTFEQLRRVAIVGAAVRARRARDAPALRRRGAGRQRRPGRGDDRGPGRCWPPPRRGSRAPRAQAATAGARRPPRARRPPGPPAPRPPAPRPPLRARPAPPAPPAPRPARPPPPSCRPPLGRARRARARARRHGHRRHAGRADRGRAGAGRESLAAASRRSPTGTSTGGSRSTSSATHRSRAAGRGRSAPTGCASERSTRRSATRTRSTSRPRPSSGWSAWSRCSCSSPGSSRWRAGRLRPPGLSGRSRCTPIHAGLDWDWELPALTLVALTLAARLATEDARPGAS